MKINNFCHENPSSENHEPVKQDSGYDLMPVVYIQADIIEVKVCRYCACLYVILREN